MLLVRIEKDNNVLKNTSTVLFSLLPTTVYRVCFAFFLDCIVRRICSSEHLIKGIIYIILVIYVSIV